MANPLLTHFVWRYWHKTFWVSSLGLRKLVHDMKGNPVIQVSCKEPSMSYKYPQEGTHILDTLLIKISTQNFRGIFLGVNQGHPWHKGWPWPFFYPPRTTNNVLQVTTSRQEGSWHTYNWSGVLNLTCRIISLHRTRTYILWSCDLALKYSIVARNDNVISQGTWCG